MDLSFRHTAIPIQPLPGFATGAVVDMLRLDLLHPVVSGNKWFKLQYNLEQAKATGHDTILSFGGAYSNHLVATAAAAQAAGLKSIGIVRGIQQSLTHTLRDSVHYGVQLHFISYEDYKQKADPAYLQQLAEQFRHPFIIPEGGANEAGRRGAGEIAAYIPAAYTHIAVSAGTGTTLAGLRNALPHTKFVCGFAPMKGGSYLQQEIMPFILPEKHSLFRITDRFHFGGFGKQNEDLMAFMKDFEQQYGFPLDRVYTAKMMFGIRALVQEQAFGDDARILAIHTGGVQGNG